MDDSFDYIDLIEQARQGDQASLDRLSSLARENLRSFVYRMTLDRHLTEDIVQETLYEMVRFLGSLNDNSSFWPWLRKIAANKYYKMNKKNQKHQTSTTSQDHPGDLQDGLACAITREWKEIVKSSIKDLTPRYRQVLTLRCYENMEYSQIAKEMDTSEILARILFYRAKKSLGKKLSQKGLGKGALLASLILFGQLTAANQCAAASIAVSANSLKVGILAVLAGFFSAKSTVTVLITAGLVAGISAPIAKNITQTNHSKAEIVIGNPASLQNNDKQSEAWYYYPQLNDESVMMRISTNGNLTFLRNDIASYSFTNGSVSLINHNHYNANLSAKTLPTDSSMLYSFLTEDRNMQANFQKITRDHDGLLVTASYHDRHLHSAGFQHINALQEGYFQCDWPAGTKIIDHRDQMHKRGWTFFELEGELDSQKISGLGSIPFVFSQKRANKPWMIVRKADKAWADTDFIGFSRPWQGLHTIDVIRRDAAQRSIPFKTILSQDKNIVIIPLQAIEYRIAYKVDLAKDLITEIRFDGAHQGKINFEYYNHIDCVENKFKQASINLNNLENLPGTFLNIAD